MFSVLKICLNLIIFCFLFALFFCCSWFIIVSLLCYVVFVYTLLLCFIGVRQHSFTMFCWCLSMPPCFVLLLLIGTSLLCFVTVHQCLLIMLCRCSSLPLCYVGVHWHFLVMFYLCLLTSPYCVLLVFISASLPCSIGVR